MNELAGGSGRKTSDLLLKMAQKRNPAPLETLQLRPDEMARVFLLQVFEKMSPLLGGHVRRILRTDIRRRRVVACGWRLPQSKDEIHHGGESPCPNPGYLRHH